MRSFVESKAGTVGSPFISPNHFLLFYVQDISYWNSQIFIFVLLEAFQSSLCINPVRHSPPVLTLFFI